MEQNIVKENESGHAKNDISIARSQSTMNQNIMQHNMVSTSDQAKETQEDYEDVSPTHADISKPHTGIKEHHFTKILQVSIMNLEMQAIMKHLSTMIHKHHNMHTLPLNHRWHKIPQAANSNCCRSRNVYIHLILHLHNYVHIICKHLMKYIFLCTNRFSQYSGYLMKWGGHRVKNPRLIPNNPQNIILAKRIMLITLKLI